MKKYNIICLSNQFFDSPLKTNKWHVMTRLAKLGHNVIFVDPPTRFISIKRLLKKEMSLHHFLTGVRKHNEGNLLIYTPINVFNFFPFSLLNTFLQVLRINTFLKVFEKKKTILWIYHFDYPDIESIFKHLNFDLVIYDVVDENSAFPEYSQISTLNSGFIKFIEKLDDIMKIKINQKGLFGKEWVKFRESFIAEKADLIFATTPALTQKFKELAMTLRKDVSMVHYTANSGDYELFKDSKDLKNFIPEDLKSIKHPIVMTSGAIDSYKLDLLLIEKCAKERPNYSFVLIGPKKVSDPTLDLTSLTSLPNVFFIGEKKLADLREYFAQADIFFIPYNLNDYTLGGCFPIKFLDALSAGLPVVVTGLPVYKEFESVCYIASSRESFVHLLDEALSGNNLEKELERKTIAKKNSWDMKVEKMLKFIEEY